MGSPVRGTRWLPVAAVVAAAWAALPPYSGPELATARGAEFADHVVPAGALLLVAAVAVALRRSAAALLACGLAVGLAGLWMTATHLPLVRQAAGGGVSWAAVTYHVLPGVAVLLLGAVWTARCWSAVEPVRQG